MKHRYYDLMDLDRYPAKFGSYKKLFGMQSEKRAKSLAKKLVREMLKELGEDMVDQATAFVFPETGFGFMHVGYAGNGKTALSDHLSKGLEPKPEHHHFAVRLSNETLDAIQDRKDYKRFYNFKPTRALYDRLVMRVQQGDKFQ